MKIIQYLLITMLICTSTLSIALPSGSYRDSCKRCEVEDHTLYCKCKEGNGRYRHTHLNHPNKCRHIKNNNGRLLCKHKIKHNNFVNRSPGPIWNGSDAKRKCRSACGNMKWTGQWWTPNNSRNSVCQCQKRKHHHRDHQGGGMSIGVF